MRHLIVATASGATVFALWKWGADILMREPVYAAPGDTGPYASIFLAFIGIAYVGVHAVFAMETMADWSTKRRAKKAQAREDEHKHQVRRKRERRWAAEHGDLDAEIRTGKAPTLGDLAA